MNNRIALFLTLTLTALMPHASIAKVSANHSTGAVIFGPPQPNAVAESHREPKANVC